MSDDSFDDDPDDHEVGYGRPPKSTRFRKGRSGNPRGRPRKAKKDIPELDQSDFDEMIEEEANRKIILRENGKPIKMETKRAVFRAHAAKALKGSRLAQERLLDRMERTEARQARRRRRVYQSWEEYKQVMETEIARAVAAGRAPPNPLPHPEDIHLEPETDSVYIRGPRSEKDLAFTLHLARHRDFMLLLSADAERGGTTGFRVRPCGAEICLWLFMAMLMDHYLPPRFRRSVESGAALMMDYKAMPARARRKLIAQTSARLDAEDPSPAAPGEIEEIVAELRVAIMAKARAGMAR